MLYPIELGVPARVHRTFCTRDYTPFAKPRKTSNRKPSFSIFQQKSVHSGEPQKAMPFG
jgi:hypothetical protein